MTDLTADSGASLSHAHDRQPYLWAGRTVLDVVLDGSQTGGSVALIDQLGRQGDTQPRHIHRGESEILYVTEGVITAWAGDETHHLGKGTAVYLPAGLPHAFRVDSDAARIITITAPTRFADFIRATGSPVDEVPGQWQFDLDRAMSAAPGYDIYIVGPPPERQAPLAQPGF